MEPAQQQFQLRDVKRRRRAAAEVNRRWTKAERPAARGSPNSSQNGLTKSRRLRAIQQVLVKRAIRTDTGAKGDVNVDVANLVNQSRRLTQMPGGIRLLFWTVVIRLVTHKIRLPSKLSCRFVT